MMTRYDHVAVLIACAALLGSVPWAPRPAAADGPKPPDYATPFPITVPPNLPVPKPPEPTAPSAPGASPLQGQVRVQPTPAKPLQPHVFAAHGGLPVTLIDVNTGHIIGRTYTDPLGQYSFPNVPAGTYKVIVGYPTPLHEEIISTPGGITDRVPLIVIPGSK